MRIELIPLLIGVAVALMAIAILVDSATDPDFGPLRERRRRVRAEIERPGEFCVGIGLLAIAGALIGRDLWRYAPIAVGIGTLLVAYGAFRNRRYLRESLFFGGTSRRKIERPSENIKLRIR